MEDSSILMESIVTGFKMLGEKSKLTAEYER